MSNWVPATEIQKKTKKSFPWQEQNYKIDFGKDEGKTVLKTDKKQTKL